MAQIYAKLSKIKTPSYRIFGYLTNAEKQEQVLCHGGTMETEQEWKELEEFEEQNRKSQEANIQAREIMLPLPNKMQEKGTQEIENFINDYCKELGLENHPYYYAVHTKHKGREQDNLHCHIVFSEREFNKEQQIKVYKKDIWQDKTTHKLTKANAENSELVHKKGEQVFKDGQPVYLNEKFTKKDLKFKQKEFLVEKNKIAKEVFEKYGYKFNMNLDKNFPKIFLKQYHLPPYLEKKNINKYNQIKNFNKQVKKYNANVSKVWIQKPKLRNELKVFRKNILSQIKNLPLQQMANVVSMGALKIGKFILNTIKQQVNQNAPTAQQQMLNAFSKSLNVQMTRNSEILEQPQEQSQEQEQSFEREF